MKSKKELLKKLYKIHVYTDDNKLICINGSPSDFYIYNEDCKGWKYSGWTKGKVAFNFYNECLMLMKNKKTKELEFKLKEKFNQLTSSL